MTIDKSKAPPGATHYNPGSAIQWRMQEHGAWWAYDAESCEWFVIKQPDTHRYVPLEQPGPAWVGLGLPPVGTVCEFVGLDASDWHRELRNGAEVFIIAHFDGPTARLAAFTFECDGGVQVEQGVENCFRPIRTPEQIAAEDREKAVQQMAGDLGELPVNTTVIPTLYAIYDAGYRKQGAP